jgi:hypothetical protein
VSSSTCYDLCPVRYSTDTYYYECNACPTYDCYSCGTNGLCTQCSAAVDFRVMNAVTTRCDAMSGYYDNGVSQAVACNTSACLTCSSATFCLSCNMGTYLSGSNTCVACSQYCLNCTNALSCVQCNTGYSYSASNGSCYLNCSTIQYCSTCSYTSQLNCLSCSEGTYLTGSNTCLNCSQFCLNCTNGSSCVQCDAGYNYSAINGSCYLSCASIQYCVGCDYSSQLNCLNCSEGTYVSASNTCINCSQFCLNCTDASSCVQCATGYNYSSSNGSCYLNCSTIQYCSTCSYTSQLNCLSCSEGTYLTGSNTCLNCSQFCLNCTNGSSCVLCDAGYNYSVTNGSCYLSCVSCLNCSEGTYLSASNTCINCS